VEHEHDPNTDVFCPVCGQCQKHNCEPNAAGECTDCMEEDPNPDLMV